MRISKVTAVIAGILIFAITFYVVPAQRVNGWAGFLVWNMHENMTSDLLEGLSSFSLTNNQIEEISQYANSTDSDEPSGEPYSHMLKKYQDVFNSYADPGDQCDATGGTETAAVEHLKSARDCFINRDDGWLMHLGRAIHYIEDSICPAHIFPFQQGWGLVPLDLRAHTEFERTIEIAYEDNEYGWRLLVNNADTTVLAELESLPGILEQAADEVALFPCSYVRQDGVRVDAPEGAFEGKPTLESSDWIMTVEDIGKSLEMASSIAKGATQWLLIQTSEILPPTITSVSPNQGARGQTFDVLLVGTEFIGTTAVTFGTGITVNSFIVDSPTQITAEITVDTDAFPGTRDITVTTSNGIYTLPDNFIVDEGEGDKGGCCNSNELGTSTTELLVGWGLLGLCWGGGYYFVRRIGRERTS